MKNFEFVSDNYEREELIRRAKNKIIELNKNLYEPLNERSQSTQATVINSEPRSQDNDSTDSESVSFDSRDSGNDVITDITNSVSQQPTNKANRRKVDFRSVESSYFDKKARAVQPSNILSGIEDELNKYIITEALPESNDEVKIGPLYFFYENRKFFSKLLKIAKSIFSICATSVPSESLFSQAGLIQTDIRNRLNPQNLENLTFLKENSF